MNNAPHTEHTYLLEIGLEEMPAQVILPATQQLLKLAQSTLEEHRISGCDFRVFSTPRRLALQITGLPKQQSDHVQKVKGPPKHIAVDSSGNWTRAAIGFAKKQGLTPDSLSTKELDGKEYLFANVQEKGESLTQLLERHAPEWIHALSFPKNMRWGYGKMRCVRAIRWIVSLWDETLIPVSLENVRASTITRGHRFLSPDPIPVPHAQNYETILEQNYVIADYEKRKNRISAQVQELEAQSKKTFRVDLTDALLQEVTNLVEYPTALLGHFEENFLELPAKVLVTSMATHQRYFPVYSTGDSTEAAQLLAHFVTVRNGGSHALKTVQEGNERVLRARLSDARFFYKDDRKQPLEYFCKKTEQIVFFQERGTIAQRVDRLADLSLFIVKQLQEQQISFTETQAQQTQRIAELCKFDLQTQMVKEFAELQGTMGGCYARLKEEADVVSRGIQEHYYPRNAKDALPQDLETLPVALADKLDLLVVAFSRGLIPSGSADPYGLRRAAQGLVHIILEKSLPLEFSVLPEHALTLLCKQQELQINIEVLNKELKQFLIQRQRFFMREQGIRYDLVNALIQSTALLPHQQWQLAKVLNPQLETSTLKSASEAIVRASNIVKKNAALISDGNLEIQTEVLLLPEEQVLHQILNSIVNLPLKVSAYMEHLLVLEPHISAFFDHVLIMDSDPQKCKNRLLLCQKLSQWSGRYLDLSELIFPKE